MARGDSSSSVVLFLTVIAAALIIALWYMSAVKPIRHSIGSVQEDLREINQHLVNACTVTLYNATYLPASRGLLETNATHLCIYDPAYTECRLLPCATAPARIPLKGGVLRITKDSEVAISPGS